MIGDPLFPDLGPKSEEPRDIREPIALAAVGLLALPGVVSYNDYGDATVWYRHTLEDIRYRDCKTGIDTDEAIQFLDRHVGAYPSPNLDLEPAVYRQKYFETAERLGLEMFPALTAYKRVQDEQSIVEALRIADEYFQNRGVSLLLDRRGFVLADVLADTSYSPGDADSGVLKDALLKTLGTYDLIPQEMIQYSNLQELYLVDELVANSTDAAGLAITISGDRYLVDVSTGSGLRVTHAHELGHLFDVAYCSSGGFTEDSVYHDLYDGPNLRRESPHEEKAEIIEDLVGMLRPLAMLNSDDMYLRGRAAHMLARIEQAVPGYGQLLLEMDLSPPPVAPQQ